MRRKKSVVYVAGSFLWHFEGRIEDLLKINK